MISLPLKKVLEGLKIRQSVGSLEHEITGLAYDSRRVEPGNLFFAITGFNVDGHLFIDSALDNGALAVIQEKKIPPKTKTTRIRVPDVRAAMAQSAANFFNHPSRGLILLGVTGTDGKTSTCKIIHAILGSYGVVGLMGTVGHLIMGRSLKTTHTTPETPEINSMLMELRIGGAYSAVMEVSSHALALKRTEGINFNLAVFTNLGIDHLDFHHDMEQYFQAKTLLFKALKPQGCAVINLDDSWGVKLAEMAPCRVLGYSLKDKNAPVYGDIISAAMDGIRMNVWYEDELIDLFSPLIGLPNAYNILSAVAAALAVKCGINDIRTKIREFTGVEGRFERIDCGRFSVIVDYAHTPQAIEALLKSLKPLTGGKLRIVFGCGGDRDKSKRPQMGSAAENKADAVYVTSDNPRSEEPEDVISDILTGMKNPTAVSVIPDRREAINTALSEADDGDMVVIAGKGHEDYQEVKGILHYFDDRKEVEKWLEREGAG